MPPRNMKCILKCVCISLLPNGYLLNKNMLLSHMERRSALKKWNPPHFFILYGIWRGVNKICMRVKEARKKYPVQRNCMKIVNTLTQWAKILDIFPQWICALSKCNRSEWMICEKKLKKKFVVKSCVHFKNASHIHGYEDRWWGIKSTMWQTPLK